MIGTPLKFSARLTTRPSHTSAPLAVEVAEIGITFATPPKTFHTIDGASRDISQDTPPLNEVKLVLTWAQALHLAEDLHNLCMSMKSKTS